MTEKAPIEAISETQAYFFEKCCPKRLYNELHNLWNAEILSETMPYQELLQEATKFIDDYYKVIQLRDSFSSEDFPF